MGDITRLSPRPAVFLDRDGTIIEDRGHLADVNDVVFYPFTFDVLRRLQRSFVLFIVTNQSGVARGIITEESVRIINEHVGECLRKEGIDIAAVYTCTHDRAGSCECIKPKPFFMYRAQRDFGLDLKRSFAVGDHPHDVAFGRNGGGTGLYVLSGHGAKHAREIEPGTEVFPTLYKAAERMISSVTPH